ncbi:hypothetical protein F383_35144 [Gossypium arboreum]|uniref:Uncharacterized protein n=1 Tax=Gossypium arboreum TaxID=29729 RepID=A0A0B0N661_GOSAR|nr:hypothetical protein F383_35144 [Gossypium arboreum]
MEQVEEQVEEQVADNGYQKWEESGASGKVASLHLPHSTKSPNIPFPNTLSSSTSFESPSELRFQRSEQGFEATQRYGAGYVEVYGIRRTKALEATGGQLRRK